MAKDIEDFLRRAAERRRQQQGQSPPSQPPVARPVPPPEAPRPVPLSQRMPQPVEPIIIDDVEIVEAVVERPSRLARQSVEEHVRSHIDTSSIAQNSSRLGSRIAQVAKEVDNRVHQHLDHDLSKIDDQPTVTDDPPPAIVGAANKDFANELRKMLSNPQAVGKAVFLAEILKRPDWD